MNIKVKQRDITDCGAACLASVAAYYKLQLPVAKLRQLASTDKKGTNILGMIEAAKKIGFDAKGVRGDFNDLTKIPKPAIAHMIVKETLHHYVVVYKVTSTHVEVMEPGQGKMLKKSHEEFKSEWTGVLVLLMPNENFEAGNKKISIRRRFLNLILPHKAVMAQIFFGAIIYTILGLSTSVFVQKIVDNVLIEGNRNLLNLLSVGMFAILLLQVFIGIGRTVFTLRTGQQIDSSLILGYYKHLLKLPQQFFDTMRVGEITSRINDAVKIRIFINQVSVDLAVNICTVLFAFVLMFSYYWKLAVVMLAIIPLYMVIYYIANLLNRTVQRKLMEDGAELESQLVESITTASTIKCFGLEDFANNKTEIRFVQLLKTIYKSGMNSVFAAVSTETISRIFTIILLWTGAGYVLDGQITAGELLSFYALTGYFTAPAASLIGINKTVQDAVIAADRLFEIMDLEIESDEEKFDLHPADIGDIRFEKVGFRYGSRTSVFEDLNLRIPVGKTTAIVGESGSGKSTLIALLQNIYPISSGNVFIGKYAVKYIRNADLRRLVGVVPQQIDLFNGNVIDNIAVGDDDPDLRLILNICESLGILSFIEDLPNGFKTQLGENGAALSGGQKQRIAIARALYQKPEILLLDEATSSLDPEAESYVQKTIDYLAARGKTIILIAHRLSTIQRADHIVVLKKGKVAEEGSHEELLREQREYFNLWERTNAMSVLSI